MTEDTPGYEGWRVAIASAVGVFVSFASLFIYTFGIFLKPLAAESLRRALMAIDQLWTAVESAA